MEDLLSQWQIKYDNDNLKTIYESIKDNQKVKDAIEFIKGDIKSSKKDYIQIVISELGEIERTTLSKDTRLIMKSPVAAAKALHLLGSKFFPIWDYKIAQAYECSYQENPAKKYVSFCNKIKEFANKVKNYISRADKTLIKLIDEYNFTKYTLGLK